MQSERWPQFPHSSCHRRVALWLHSRKVRCRASATASASLHGPHGQTRRSASTAATSGSERRQCQQLRPPCGHGRPPLHARVGSLLPVLIMRWHVSACFWPCGKARHLPYRQNAGPSVPPGCAAAARLAWRLPLPTAC